MVGGTMQSMDNITMAELKMLCGPVPPPPESVVSKLCKHLGYQIVADASSRADLALYWDPATWRQPPPDLLRLASGIPILNVDCHDFSKHRVNDVHQQVFGRSLRVDPRVHGGAFVVKSDQNAKHDGRIVSHGTESPAAGFIYQRVVNNEVGDGMVVDLRTPIIGSRIPLVYKLYRPVTHRFDVDDARAEIVETSDVYSDDELRLLRQFATGMGMDYGELDVLRDRESGEIWVVDANPTPWGPPRTLGEDDHRSAVTRLSAAFHAMATELIA
jgi:hypothetical protein